MKTKKSKVLRIIITLLTTILLMSTCVACSKEDLVNIDSENVEDSGIANGNTPKQSENPVTAKSSDIVVVLEPSLNIDYLNRTLVFREGLTCVEYRAYEGKDTIGNLFVDTNGNIIINGDELGFEIKWGGFNSGRALTTEGFIDKNGNVLDLLKNLSEAEDERGGKHDWGYFGDSQFSEGLALVTTNPKGINTFTGGYAFINAEGDIEINLGHEYRSVRPFNEGFALVSKLIEFVNGPYEYGLIDKSGNYHPLGEWYSVYEFHEGFAYAKKERNGDVYYIDTTGNIAFQFPAGFDNDRGDQFYFSEGLLGVYGIMGSEDEFGFIGTDGEIIIPPTYTFGDTFSEGLACMTVRDDENEKYGYISKDGETIIPFEYSDARSFSEGFAPVKNGGLWGFIDKKGNVIVDFEYDKVFPFSEGYAWVVKDGKCGILQNKTYNASK